MMRSKQRGAAATPPACLLRLHRHSLVSVLVTGGTAREREAMACAFHRASPLRDRPFMTLDCGRDQTPLRRALQSWLQPARGGLSPNPLRDVEGGTLFLDRLERLPAPAQQQLLVLARHIQRGPGAGANPMPARLAAGSAALPLDDSPKGIVPELLDCLDKIRVEVGVAVAGADLKKAAEAGPESGRASQE
jgi:DNA-binding NtrC family response regulator